MGRGVGRDGGRGVSRAVRRGGRFSSASGVCHYAGCGGAGRGGGYSFRNCLSCGSGCYCRHHGGWRIHRCGDWRGAGRFTR